MTLEKYLEDTEVLKANNLWHHTLYSHALTFSFCGSSLLSMENTFVLPEARIRATHKSASCAALSFQTPKKEPVEPFRGSRTALAEEMAWLDILQDDATGAIVG